MVSSTCGSAHISLTALSMSAVPDPGRLLYWCYVESHKGRSSGRYSSFYAQRTWCGWWSLLNCVRTCMLTTPRSTGIVDQAPLTVYGIVLLTVSLLSPTGCVPIDFNSTHRRRMYCGAPQPVDKVSYPPIHWPLDLTSCHLSDACVISVSSSTLT